MASQVHLLLPGCFHSFMVRVQKEKVDMPLNEKLVYLFRYRRRVSRSKKLLKSIRICLKDEKDWRELKIKRFKEDMVLQLKRGQFDSALYKAELVLRNQNTRDSLDLLGRFCELLIINLHNIYRTRKYPKQINEAMASLCYAADKSERLSVLECLANLFHKHNFKKPAIKLLPGNYVINKEIIDKLCVDVTYEQKLRLVEEIITEHDIELETLKVVDHDSKEGTAYEIETHDQSIQPEDTEDKLHECDSSVEDSESDLEEVLCRRHKSTYQPDDTEDKLHECDSSVEDSESDLEEVLCRTQKSTYMIHKESDNCTRGPNLEINTPSPRSHFSAIRGKLFVSGYGNSDDQCTDGRLSCESPIKRRTPSGEGWKKPSMCTGSPVSHSCGSSGLTTEMQHGELSHNSKFVSESKDEMMIYAEDTKKFTFPDPVTNYHEPVTPSSDLPCQRIGDCKTQSQHSSLSCSPKALDYDELVKGKMKASVENRKSSTFPFPEKKDCSSDYQAPMVSSSDHVCKGAGDGKIHCQPSFLSHVHQKLSEHDELLAKFTVIMENILDEQSGAASCSMVINFIIVFIIVFNAILSVLFFYCK